MAERERYTDNNAVGHKIRFEGRPATVQLPATARKGEGGGDWGRVWWRPAFTNRRHGADDAEGGQPKRATVGEDPHSCSTVVDVATDE